MTNDPKVNPVFSPSAFEVFISYFLSCYFDKC